MLPESTQLGNPVHLTKTYQYYEDSMKSSPSRSLASRAALKVATIVAHKAIRDLILVSAVCGIGIAILYLVAFLLR